METRNEDEDLDEWAARREAVRESADNGNGFGMRLGVLVRLLPTPAAADGVRGPDYARANRDGSGGDGRPRAPRRGGSATETVALLPTPQARDHKGRDIERDGGPSLPEALATVDWADYAPAIARHEATFGRAAPSPTDDKGRLSPAFVEWMMMLPAGHVTDVAGLSRSAQLRILGNGIVPACAAAAWRALLDSVG